MKPVTFFTIPKSFTGIFDVIQRNAILSWLALNPTPEVILFGNDEGVAEFAEEHGLVHVPDVMVSERGTPYLDDAFLKVSELAKNDILVYSNADMIYVDDFPSAIDLVEKKFPGEFMVVGQRWDVDLPGLLDFKFKSIWMSILFDLPGKLHPTCGIDYFIFRKGSWKQIPPYIVGRPGWDNWLIGEALRSGHAVVDASGVVFAVHQNHDYSHIVGGRQEARSGFEATLNKQITKERPIFIDEANWMLLNDGDIVNVR